MDLEAVCWFVEVIRFNSFSKAAHFLNQPASNVSRRIGRLEQQLGCRLLLRTTRALSLTDEGQSFLPLAKQLQHDQQQISDWALHRHQFTSGTLRITAPIGFTNGPLSDWLIDYKKQNPEVKIELIDSNDYLNFQDHQLDFAFRQGPLNDSSLIAKELFKIKYGVFIAPELLAKTGPINSLNELTKQPLIAISAKGKALPWSFTDVNLQLKDVDMMFEDFWLCTKAAVQGLGITYASWYEAQPLVESGQLVSILEHLHPSPRAFYLLYTDRKFRPKKNQAFLTLVEQMSAQFKELPDSISYRIDRGNTAEPER
jgi:DNA-binding transcriptional LysR family regulator